MVYLFSVITIAIIVLSFLNIKYSIALYWCVLCLIPLDKLPIFSLSVSWTGLTLLLLIVFLFKNCNKLQYRPIYPLALLFISFLFFIPIHNDTPYDFQIHAWTMDICRTVIVPFIAWNIYTHDKSIVPFLFYSTVVCIVVSVIYSYVLLDFDGVNPYIMLMYDLSGNDIFDQIYVSEARLFGRISSVFLHPMTFALFLGLSAIFIAFCFSSFILPIRVALVSSILLMSLLCGVRSIIAGLLIACVYYLFRMRKLKYLFIALIIVILIFMILSLNDDALAYVSTMFDLNPKSSGIEGGSSIGMRLEQLNGCFSEISSNPLFGKGYGWTDYYLSKSASASHPKILAFESLVFVVLCENGLMGIVMWIVYSIVQFRIIRVYTSKEKRIILESLFVYYLSYSIITGEYGYMQYFSMFYIICLMKGRNNDSRNILISKTS